MNGIVINIDPVLFRLGNFELRWYSLAIILGIVAAVLIASHLAKSIITLGYTPPEQVYVDAAGTQPQ